LPANAGKPEQGVAVPPAQAPEAAFVGPALLPGSAAAATQLPLEQMEPGAMQNWVVGSLPQQGSPGAPQPMQMPLMHTPPPMPVSQVAPLARQVPDTQHPPSTQWSPKQQAWLGLPQSWEAVEVSVFVAVSAFATVPVFGFVAVLAFVPALVPPVFWFAGVLPELQLATASARESEIQSSARWCFV